MSKEVTLEDLKGSMCKWPFGDPKHDGFHFCGDRRITGESYCTKHTEMAYRPNTSRAGQKYQKNKMNNTSTGSSKAA